MELDLKQLASWQSFYAYVNALCIFFLQIVICELGFISVASIFSMILFMQNASVSILHNAIIDVRHRLLVFNILETARASNFKVTMM